MYENLKFRKISVRG